VTISVTKSNTYKTVSSIIYVRHLGRHHFAHLRAVAEGIDTVDSAKRYLGVEHGHAAQNAHLQTRDAIRLNLPNPQQSKVNSNTRQFASSSSRVA